MTMVPARPSLLTPPVLWGLASLAAIALSLAAAGLFQQELFNPGGLPQLGRFFRASLQPDLSREMLQLTVQASLVTLAYAVCGTFLSLLLGLLGGVVMSEVWWQAVLPQRRQLQPPPIWFGLRAFLAVPRAIHEVIWGLFFLNLWGLDPLTAILAIALPYGAIVAKVFSEILDETPRQPLQALLNSGAPPFSAFCYSLLPQAFLNLLSYSFYRFECAIRSAAVLGIIGAGGLGYQMLLSLQSLRYEQLWTFFYAMFVLNGLVDFSSAWLRRRWGCASRLDLNASAAPTTRTIASNTPSFAVYQPLNQGLALLLVGLIAFCFWYIQPDFSKLWAPRTGQLLTDLLHACWPPDWSQGWQLVKLSADTVAMSVLAIALSATVGLLLAFPAAHNFFLPGGLLNPTAGKNASLLPQILFLLSRAILLMGRAIPAPIWALVVLFVLFPGILPGAIALALHNLGILGRLMAEVIENLDQRPLLALQTTGAPASLVFLYGVLPLTMPRFLSYSLYRWEVCMRETVIVGLVGAGGLGRLLTEQLSSFDYQGLMATLTCFLVLTFGVDWVSASARRSLR